MKENLNNESVHSDLALSAIVDDIKEHLGIVLVAEAGHGKSFTAFSIVKEALKDPNMTVIIMSPSTIWRRNYGAINCIKVGTSEFNPIIAHEETKLEVTPYLRDSIHIDLDKKWSYVKSAWLENLLKSKQSLLFDIKYKNGRRIKAFETVVLEFLYDMQSAEIDRNPNYKHHYLIVLEEIQNCFGTYSMNADDSLELFTVFTQSRSDANLHYVAIGQRLNDISCKVVERLRPLIGLTLGENSLRKLKAMIPDEQTKKRIQQLPKRHWIYLDGKQNPEIEIPEYKKEGHVTYLKPTQQQPQQKLTLMQRFKDWANGKNYKSPTASEIAESEESEQEAKEDEIEDSQGDGLMSEGDIMFPEEI
ncbi:MAG: hypothetical protein ABSF65_02030 [Candidatus Bathyarchaeia archaeon]|jgi:hypothetical protein